jgi:hypothetical protein
MIFGHSIIPHNHVETNSIINCGHKHSCSVDQNRSDASGEFHNRHSDTKICSISGFLFHQLSQDSLFLPAAGDYHSSSFLQKGFFNFNREQNLYINKFFGSASLRSPPVA